MTSANKDDPQEVFKELLARVKSLETAVAAAKDEATDAKTEANTARGELKAAQKAFRVRHKPIVFVDLRDRDDTEAKRLTARKGELEGLKGRSNGVLPTDLQNELDEVTAKVGYIGVVPVDPVFTWAQEKQRWALLPASTVLKHVAGKFPTQLATPPVDLKDGPEEEKELAAVHGILLFRNVEPPPLHTDDHLRKDLLRRENTAINRFDGERWEALGDYRRYQSLFEMVFNVLAVPDRHEGPAREIDTREWARIVFSLVDQGVKDTDYDVEARVEAELLNAKSGSENLAPSRIRIEVPNLEGDVEFDEDKPHRILTAQPKFMAAMLEELKAFAVVDKLVEQFQDGILPIPPGESGNLLFRYWKESASRINEPERRRIYAITFGFTGGDDAGMPNREFQDLWFTFPSAVSSLVRQQTVDSLLRATIPGAVSQQQVRQAGLSLAENLAVHGFGMAHYVATELQKQIKDMVRILSADDIRNAYGARDMWQVIDQVAALELGGARNSIRYRTLATAGSIIIAWLAKNVKERLSGSAFGPVLDLAALRSGTMGASPNPTSDPNDYDLWNACEQYLLANGTGAQEVLESAEKGQIIPNMTSKPIQIPSVARDLLESVGVTAPMGFKPNGSRR
jgi:hypothetical protein